MFSKKFTALTSVFLIFAIVVGGMLGFYDARLEAAVTPIFCWSALIMELRDLKMVIMEDLTA